MVNDEIDWHLGIDLFGVPSHFHHGVTQSSQIYNRWNTREVLKNDSGWTEGNLSALTLRRPGCDGSYVVFGDEKAIMCSQRPFEENTNRVRQMAG